MTRTVRWIANGGSYRDTTYHSMADTNVTEDTGTPSSSSSSSSSDNKASATPTASSTENDGDDDYLIQLMLLDQQCKHIPGYVPKATSMTRKPRRYDAVMGNLFVDGKGDLVCNECATDMFRSDAQLWPDLKQHVHLSIPLELRSGPDLHQCFCGYFSFRLEDLERHLAMETRRIAWSGRDQNKVLNGLKERIEKVGMHEDCQRKLIALIKAEEY